MTQRYRITETVIAAVLAVIFVLTGAPKLVALPMMVDQFTDWSYPVWFMYLVGLMEIVGAGLLVSIRTRRFGAFLIGIVMVGAIATHVRVGELHMTPVPLAILLVTLWLMQRRAPTHPAEDDADERAPEKERSVSIGSR